MTNSLTLKGTEKTVLAAARIASEFDFPLTAIAKLIYDVAQGEFTDARMIAAIKMRAIAVAAALNAVLPALARVHALDYGEGYGDRIPPHLSVEVLSLAMRDGCTTRHLRRFGAALQKVSYIAGNLTVRNDEPDAHMALMLAKVMTALQFWIDADRGRVGILRMTMAGPAPDDYTGLHFITEVMCAAHDYLTIDDLAAAFDIVRSHFDLDEYDAKWSADEDDDVVDDHPLRLVVQNEMSDAPA